MTDYHYQINQNRPGYVIVIIFLLTSQKTINY